MNNQDQLEIPIQPVENPILCSPYEEPGAGIGLYDTETGEADRGNRGGARQGTGTKRNAPAANNVKCASFKRRSGMTCRW